MRAPRIQSWLHLAVVSNAGLKGLQVLISRFSGHPGAMHIDQVLQCLLHLLPCRRGRWWGVEIVGDAKKVRNSYDQVGTSYAMRSSLFYRLTDHGGG